MADIKISELPVADQANIDDLLEASQVSGPGYVSRHISLDQVATVVADSTQITDLVDDAIGEIPPLTWDNIVDKPTTFPPTVPIAWDDISGEPTTFPPTIPTGGAIATWPYLPLTGGTLTGALTGTTATMSGTVTGALGRFSSTASTLATVATTDGQYSLRAAGNTKALLVTHDATATTIAGTDQTGFGSFQPLKLYGSSVEAPTPAALDNSTKIATTAFVTAALAGGGASISVGTSPPGSPAANALWWNSDATIGGGQMFIFYDGFWVPASPGVGSGAVVQTVSYQTGAVATGTTLIPFDDTIPQIGEGNEYMTLAITPRSATSKLIIEVTFIGANSATNWLTAALFQDATANALAAATANVTVAAGMVTVSFKHTMTSGTTSATTFRVRAGGHAVGTVIMNGDAVGIRKLGGVMASSIVIQEVL